jgi:hypothetical protein
MRQLCSTVGVVVLTVACGMPRARAQQSQYDFGNQDTLGVVYSVLPDAFHESYNLKADLYIYVDSNTVNSVSSGFRWTDPRMHMDSAVSYSLTLTAFDMGQFFYHWTNIDTTNVYRWFLFAGLRQYGPGIGSSNQRQFLASYYFTFTDWAAEDSVVIDSAWFSAGTRLTFVTEEGHAYRPYRAERWTGYDFQASCCVLRTGDANCNGGDEPTIGDISRLVDYLFISGDLPCCIPEADVNQSGGANPTLSSITIGDISYLQDYLFITGPSLGLPNCY